MHRFKTFFLGAICSGLALCATATAGEQLPYPAREAVKRQQYNINKATQTYDQLKKTIESGKETNYAASFDEISRTLDSVESDLTKNKAPTDHPDVKSLLDRVKELQEKLPPLRKQADALQKAGAEKADPSNYPHFERDVARIKELWQMYRAFETLRAPAPGSIRKQPREGLPPTAVAPFMNLDAFIDASSQYDENVAYFEGAKKRNALLLASNEGAKSKFEAVAKPAQTYMDKFGKVKDDVVDGLADIVSVNLEVASDAAKYATEQKKPDFFKGGVKQAMQYAAKSFAAYKAIKKPGNPDVIRLESKMRETTKALDAAEDSLAAELLAMEKMPVEAYSGADKATLKTLVEAEWKKLYPTDSIIAIVFSQANWNRKTSWNANAVEWYKIDTSVLVAEVIVKQSDAVAVIYPIYLNKDHLKNDEITVGAQTKGVTFVQRKILMKNVH